MIIHDVSIQTNSRSYVSYLNGTETITIQTFFTGIIDEEEFFTVKLVAQDKSSSMSKAIKVNPEIILSKSFVCNFTVTLTNNDKTPVDVVVKENLVVKKYNVIVHAGNHHHESKESDSDIEWTMDTTIDIALSDNYRIT